MSISYFEKRLREGGLGRFGGDGFFVEFILLGLLYISGGNRFV